jgi:hypothetical protein
MSGAMMVSVGTFVSAASAALPFDFIGPPQLVSASLNGTSQYLSASNAAFTFTGDFTVEGWYRPTSVTGLKTLFTLGTSTFASGSYVLYSSAGAFQGQLFGGSATSFSAGTMSINTWYHIALVRSGSTIKLYVNGTAGSGTSTQAGTIGNGAVTIGFMAGGYGYFAGQISNFRVAASAVYTTAFTTPIKPLSLTGAAFFAALGVSPFVDSSSNAISITNTGTVALTDQSPFNANWVDSVSGIVATVGIGNAGQPTYDAKYGGGINCEEAVRPYVDVPTTRTGVGGYTISMLANVPSNSGGHYVALFTGNNLYPTGGRSGNYIYARKWSNFETGSFASANTTIDLNFPTGALTNPPAWYDWVYNGTSVTVYRNGLLITNFSMTAAAGWLNPLRFAGDESQVLGNSMAIGTLYRMKHQTTALDASGIATQFETVRASAGGGTLAGSLSFPGGSSGTNMLVLGTPPTIGAGSYTIECWFYANNFTAGYGLCGATAAGGISVYVANSTTITTDKYGGGGSFSYTVPTMSANTWYHLVLVRSGTTSAVFLNGKRAGSTQTDSLNYNGTTPHIGSFYGGCWPGLMTNFRIVVGTAVYSPSFSFCTPPIGPLTSITNTKYLMLGAATTTDTSGTTAVTVTGTVTTSTTKPF